MSRRKRRSFTTEFKSDAVRLCQIGDRTVAQVATELDLTEGSLREWVKRGEITPPKATAEPLSAAERGELAELRKRVKRLEVEREILKKAAAFFAKETT